MLVRGTTPTIRWRFSKIPVDDIAVAFMTVKQNGELLTEKSIEDAKVDGEYLVFSLTQEDTLKLTERDKAKIQLRYKTKDGYAGASAIYKHSGKEILKDGVI